jgi:hypothetical protein
MDKHRHNQQYKMNIKRCYSKRKSSQHGDKSYYQKFFCNLDIFYRFCNFNTAFSFNKASKYHTKFRKIFSIDKINDTVHLQ